MFIRYLKKLSEFVAADGCRLWELFNPVKDRIKLGYSLAVAKLKPKMSSKPHVLKASEVYYILKGKGVMHIDDETAKVCSGCAVYIPPGSTQYIENKGKSALEFICIVDPAWRPEFEKEVKPR